MQPSLKSKKSPPKVPQSSFSLETYFSHPKLFGVPAAPVQRAKCRLFEGLPLGELANDPAVQEMLGNGGAPWPSWRPVEVLDISAIRIGKSLFGAAFIVWQSQTVDLSSTIASDIIRIFVVALKIDGCAAVMKHLVQNLLDKPALRVYLADDPKEVTLAGAIKNGLRLKQLSTGKIIEVKCIPLDRGGGSGLSVFCAGVVVDEYPRMIGASDGVRNVEHFREGVLGRLLPGAMYLATGSPWQAYGPAYDLVQKHFGKPTEDLLVLRTSAKSFVGIAPDWTERKRAKLERQSALAYKTDFLAEFADGEQSVFPAAAIEAAWTKQPPANAEYGTPAIFADPSALRHDYWAAMIGGWSIPVASLEDLYEIEQLGDVVTPGRGQVVPGRDGWIRILEDDHGNPLPRKDGSTARPCFEVFDIVSWDKKSGARGTDLVKQVGLLGRRYGCTDFHWDGYEQLMLGDLVRQEGFRPIVHTWSGAGRKTEAVDHLRTLLIEQRVRLPKHDLLKQELIRFQARPTPGGNFQYIVAGGAGHGDHASCLTLAMRADLDGFVDRSPTMRSNRRTEILDHEDTGTDYDS